MPPTFVLTSAWRHRRRNPDPGRHPVRGRLTPADHPGTPVLIWTCNGQSNQQWRHNSDGSITGVQSGLCLDVNGAATANGTAVILWTCNGQGNQKWTLTTG